MHNLLKITIIIIAAFFTMPFYATAGVTLSKPPAINNIGLVGHWTFDGKDTVWTSATAATTLDKSGQGNTGTLTSMAQATSPTIGKIGQGLKFDEVNDDYVNIGDKSSLEFSSLDSFSISVWVKPGSADEAGYIFSK